MRDATTLVTELPTQAKRSILKEAFPKARLRWWALLSCLAALTTGSDGTARPSKISAECTFRGHRLYGKIQIVERHADLKVRVVERFADLKVQLVERFPKRCGQWQLVERFADTKVRLVQRHPDVTIRYVERFPGY